MIFIISQKNSGRFLFKSNNKTFQKPKNTIILYFSKMSKNNPPTIFLHSKYMIDNRFVCKTPENKYCGNPRCPLSHLCKAKPLIASSFRYDLKVKGSQIQKTEEEKRKHQKLYRMYNRLFGDLRDKNIIYSRMYYRKNREKILKSLRKPFKEQKSIVTECSCDCFDCPYEDCVMEGYGDRKEYMKLYYVKFHDRLLKQKAQYRKEHRTYLSNSEKLRNYRNKGYKLTKGVFNGKKGVFTILLINQKPYVSFISDDRLFSIRRKINHIKEDKNQVVVVSGNDVLYFKIYEKT